MPVPVMTMSVFAMAMSVSVMAAAAPVMTVEGDVVAVHSYWTDDGSRIETDATIQTSDGQQVVVNQFGGTVDGVGMIQMPGDRVLEVGMHVAVAAHTGRDLSQREHVVLDSMKIITDVPGFVRTGPTSSGNYLYWESGCAFVTPDSAGTTAIPGDQEFDIIQKAIDEWNTKTESASCSYFKVVNAGPKPMETTNDKVNVIKFRDTPCNCDGGGTSWGCRPATMTSPAKCYSSAAAGITTAVYINDPNSTRDGAIVDADIELNGVDFDISVGGMTSTPRGKCLADLQNTLTHELGHLHGLEHTCRLSVSDPQWIDDQKNPVPLCTAVPPGDTKITGATMYPTQTCGETSKSKLSDDDIQAICTIYPTAKNPGTCEPVGGTTTGGCCSASRGADRPVGALLLAGVVALWVRRRRNSRAA
jgi:MYXO-CTERM domain-containing protein